MYCKKCGKQLSDEVRFCPDCGADNGVIAGKKLKKMFSDEKNALEKGSTEEKTGNVSREGSTYASISLFLLIFGILLPIFLPSVSIACLIFSVVISLLARGKVEKGSKEYENYDILSAVGIILLIIFIAVGTVFTMMHTTF